jgi:hypothetical protein
MDNKWNTENVAPKGFNVQFCDMGDQSDHPMRAGRNPASPQGTAQNLQGDRLGTQLPNEVGMVNMNRFPTES